MLLLTNGPSISISNPLADERIRCQSGYVNVTVTVVTPSKFGLDWLGERVRLIAYLSATGLNEAMITAHPYDISGGKVQASIRKVASSPVYRVMVEADPEAQDLVLKRARLLNAAVAVARPACRCGSSHRNAPSSPVTTANGRAAVSTSTGMEVACSSLPVCPYPPRVK